MSDDQQRTLSPQDRTPDAQERFYAPTDRFYGENRDEAPEVEGHRIFGTADRTLDGERWYDKG
jgi:hypothetical protein